MGLHQILGRIVRILKRTVPADRRAQWEEEWLNELQVGFAPLATGEKTRRFPQLLQGMLLDCLTIGRVHRARNRRRFVGGTAAGWAELFAGDVRYAMRMIRRSPSSSFVAVAALAFGIGLSTFSFSVVYGSYMRTLPYEEAGNLFFLEMREVSGDGRRVAPTRRNFDAWRDQQRSFEDLGGYGLRDVTLSGGGQRPEVYFGAAVTPSTFRLLRVNALLGRTFVEDDSRPGAPGVAMIAHSVWRDRFGEDPEIVGKAITVNGEPAAVIGVMPEQFQFPEFQEIWLPLTEGEPDSSWVGNPFGRLREGVTSEQAATEVAGFAGRVELQQSRSDGGFVTTVTPFSERFAEGDAVLVSAIVLGAALLLLVVACANVANLLFARMWVRTGEIAVRTALGADRRRVISQVVVETVVLAFLGAPIGLLMAFYGLEWVNVASAHEHSAFWHVMKIDGIAVAFTVTVTLLASLLAGVLPALRASRTDVNQYLKEGGFGGGSLRIGKVSRTLVVVQIAACFGLLAVSGLMMKGVVRLADIDLGFEREPILTATIGLTGRDYPSDDARKGFWDRLESRLTAIPGVVAVAVTTVLPGNSACCVGIEVEGHHYDTDEDRPLASSAIVSPQFFDVFNLAVLQGRLPGDIDQPGTPAVAVANRSFVDRFFPGQDALGRRIRLGPERPWTTIVGVVADQHLEGLENPTRGYPAGVYLPRAQNVTGYHYVALRARGDGRQLVDELRGVVAALDPDLPMSRVRTMDEVVGQETFIYRVFALLFILSGTAALFLTVIGLWGVVSLTVSQRTREVGLRIALGEGRLHLLIGLIRKSSLEVVLGLAIGSVFTLGLTRSMRFLFYGVEPWDPTVLGGIGAAFVVTALVATVIPALRATGVDPVTALRKE